MREIPIEQRLERYDVISQPLRDALNSEAVDQMLWTIGEAHHLGEERTLKMVKVVGFVVMGFIHPEDLPREIVSEIGVDKRLADEMAREVQVKVLNPLMPEINAAFHYHIAGVPAPTTPAPATPAEPERLRPAFAPPQAGKARSMNYEVGETERPFILQKEQEEAQRVQPVDESLMRPSFYEGAEGGSMDQEVRSMNEPTAARLEIGPMDSTRSRGLRQASPEPEVARTEEPEIRVVHYSGPQTPVDPFAPQTQEAGSMKYEVGQERPPLEKPKEVHPENIVDLKDLPK